MSDADDTAGDLDRFNVCSEDTPVYSESGRWVEYEAAADTINALCDRIAELEGKVLWYRAWPDVMEHRAAIVAAREPTQ